MPIGLPAHLRPQVLIRAFRSGTHSAAAVALAAAFALVAAMQAAQPALILWPALIALMPFGAALWYLDRFPGYLATVGYLLVGTAATYWFSFTVMTELRLESTAYFALSAVRIALLLGGGPGGVQSMIGWSSVGLGLAEAAVIAAAIPTGTPLAVDTTSLATFLLAALILVGIRFSLRRSRRAQPTLHRATRDARLAELRYDIQSRAAAVMHDTVLGHLAVIAHTPPGRLPDRLRAEMERDVAILVGEEWLTVEDGPAVAADEWQASALLSAIDEGRALGLVVQASGDLAAVGRLGPEASRALGQAVKQCLVNVARHAGTGHADVVVYGSESDVTVMVLDSGRGFDISSTAADRLGIRQSIRRRLEAAGGEAQVWSTPGHGTSVVLRVPAAPLRAVLS